MKVALLSHEGGGISSVANGLAAGLAKMNVEATIFTTTTCEAQRSLKTSGGYGVTSLPMIDLPPRSLWFHLRHFNALRRMLEDYDVVHAVSPEMAIPLVMFKGFEKPLIVTIHGSHRASLKAFMSSPMRHWTLGDFALNVLELPLHESTTRLCFGRSEKVVVCSFSTLAEIRKYERVDVSKATVIYNGVDFDDAERDLETNDETKYSDEKPTMLYAGRLFWMKGIHYVLEAFRKIKKDLEVRLRIFGKGPMQTSAADFVRQNNLQDDVFLGGFLPHRELIREIRLADAVVFPSLYESQPMFALEAMACGKPLVAFDLPYARELVSHGHNGLLARPADADDLAAKAKSVLQDRTLGRRIGRNAYTYVKCNHDWKKQAGKYLQLYEEA